MTALTTEPQLVMVGTIVVQCISYIHPNTLYSPNYVACFLVGVQDGRRGHEERKTGGKYIYRGEIAAIHIKTCTTSLSHNPAKSEHTDIHLFLDLV